MVLNIPAYVLFSKKKIMRISIVFVTLLLCSKAYSQSAPKALPYSIIKINKITDFIDSIKNKLLTDTIKFNG